MSGPMLLWSWWEVAFLLVFVFLSGMSEVSPFWKHWFGPIIIGMFVLVVVATTLEDARR